MKTETETYYHYFMRNGEKVIDKEIRKERKIKERKEISLRRVLLSILFIESIIILIYIIKESIHNASFISYIVLFFSLFVIIGAVITSVLVFVRLFRDLFVSLFRGYKKGEEREREKKEEKIWPSPPYLEAPRRNVVKRKQTKKEYSTGGLVSKEYKRKNWPDYLIKQDKLYNETYKDFILDPKTTIKRPGTTFKQNQIVENLNDC